jgi:hypothetical protein
MAPGGKADAAGEQEDAAADRPGAAAEGLGAAGKTDADAAATASKVGYLSICNHPFEYDHPILVESFIKAKVV